MAMPTHAATPMVAADIWQSLALHADGTVRSWGNDRHGELGIGTILSSPVPLRVGGLPPVRPGAASIAADSHVLAIAEDGGVWAWGWNIAGQLGDGTAVDRTSPVRVRNLTHAIAVAAGDLHSLAITAGGDVWTWGSNDTGQLGDPALATICPGCERHRPQKIQLAGAVAIAAGRRHSLVLLADGTVWAFGQNAAGQLGDGTFERRTSPVRVSGLSNVVAIATSHVHSLALKSDGTVWAWGSNVYGQLGDGTTINRPTPVQVSGVLAVGIAAPVAASYARRADGSVLVWGGASPVPTVDPAHPQPVSDLRARGPTIALLADGSVWQGGLVPGLAGVTHIASGARVSLARRGDGTLHVWGTDFQGELATGRALNRTTPSNVLMLRSVTQVASGGTSLALHADGTVSSWGGDNTTPAPVAGVSGMIQVAAGGGHKLALRSDGTVWSWGGNPLGQLGRGAVIGESQPPAMIPGLSGVTRIAAVGNVSAAVRGGRVLVWGVNDPPGILGVPATAACPIDVGTVACTPTPTEVPGLDSVIDVAPSAGHLLARRADGSVWAWGDNRRGALGAAELGLRPTPAPVDGLAGVVQVAAGGSSQSMALKGDGTVWAWGDNSSGQLGNAGPAIQSAPVQIAGLTGITRIAYGGDHGLALRADGAIWSWGGNSQGQLGDGTLLDRYRPGIVVREAGAGTLDGNDWFLRLDPLATVTIPASARPNVLVVSRGARTAQGVTLDATAKQKSAEAGRNVGLYVLAMVPPEFFNLVKLAPGAKSAAEVRAKTGEALVLAQLTPLGWTNVQGQLIAHSHGVASAAGSAASILDGIRAASIPGARFCIGYGETSNSMLTSLTLRELLEVPGAASVASGAPCLLSGVYVGGPASSRMGTAVTFTASVVGLSPTGHALFFDGSARMSGKVALAAANEAVGQAQLATASLATGVHSIAASYSGDGQNAAVPAAQSVPLRHEVVAPQAATRVELAGPSASEHGAAVAFTARVVGDRPTGTLQLKDAGANLGPELPLADSSARFVVSSLSLGNHSISAVYSGDGANAGSTSNVVAHTVHSTLATRVGLASSANPSAPGAAVTLTATVTGTHPTGSVAFRDGATVIATLPLAGGSASTTLHSLSAGLHVLAADYLGDGNNPAASSPELHQQVTAAALTLPSFASRFDVPPSTLIRSDTIVLSGIASATAISVTGGEYSIGCTASFTTVAATVNAGQSVCVRHVSAGAFAATTRTTLFVGTATAEFASVTMSAAFRSGIAALVSHYYRAPLRRAPDPSGQAFWEGEALRLGALGANMNEAFYAMAMAFFGSAEYAAFSRDDGGYVTDLYATFFNRVPDSDGLSYWSGQLASGMPRDVLLAQFMFSPEFASHTRGLFGNRAVRAEIDMVTDFYRGLLARPPDSDGFEYWLRRFRAAQCAGAAQVGAEVTAISSAFAGGGEYSGRRRGDTGYVSDLYNAFLRRGGDLRGVQYWIHQVTSGARTREQLRQEFVASREFDARVGAVLAQGCLPGY